MYKVTFVIGVCSEAADLLQDIYARLETMDASTAEPRAAEILCGLGFTAQMQVAPVSTDFSGNLLAVLIFHEQTVLAPVAV